MSRLPRDEERIDRLTSALAANSLDAFLCAVPSNVLMLSGYWPVIGNAVCVVTREGRVALIVPEDEEEIAASGWADLVRTFHPGSLDQLKSINDILCRPLSDLGRALEFHPGTKIGFEGGTSFYPSGYASMFSYGADMRILLDTALPSAVAVDATGGFARLQSVLTRRELSRLRRACDIAAQAFSDVAPALSTGMREFQAAALLRSELAAGDDANERCDGFAYCMSGPNSARAYAAFQQSGSRSLTAGDFALVHCNSYCGGFWTDITRTYLLGEPSAQKAEMTEAVIDAGREALEVVRPGIKASAVDDAARRVLSRRGFGKAFKHATGHGVGFSAIDHNALPRIHPLSAETLEQGMVFNIEPAVYIADLGGVRQCNVVAVTHAGAELLTPFHNQPGQLVIR
jgi:Xaa-Pro aminopeptidase